MPDTDTAQRETPVRREMTIRWRLALLVAIAMAPFALFAPYYAYQERVDAVARALDEAEAQAVRVALRLEAHVRLLQALGAAAEAVAADDLDDRKRVEAGLRRMLAEVSTSVAGIRVFAPDGQLIAGPLSGTEQRGEVNIADREHFRAALHSRAFVVGAPVAGRGLLSGEWILPVARPILDSRGAVRAVIVILTLARSLDAIMDAHRGDPDNWIKLVTEKGIAIAHAPPRPDLRGSDLSGVPHFRAARAGGTFKGETVTMDGVQRYGASVPVGNAPWQVFYGIPAAKALAPANEELFRLGAIAAAMLLTAALASWWLARELALPIIRLREGVNTLARTGRLERMTVEGAREIAELANDINRMSARLEESQAQEQARRKELLAIYLLSNTVTTAESLEAIYAEAMASVLQLLKADRMSILLFDADGVMRFKAWRALSDSYRAATEGHSPWTANTSDPQPILVEDVERDPGLGQLRQAITAEGVRALGFVPLVEHGRLLGKFMVYFDTPHRFTDGDIRLLRTVSHHISSAIARVQAREALRDSEQRYRGLVELSPDAVLVWVGERVVFANEAAARLLGAFEAQAIAGRSLWDVVAPEYHAQARGRLARIASAGGNVPLIEQAYLRLDGSRVPVEAASAGVEYGKRPAVLTVARDVSERKRLEELIRQNAERRALAVQAAKMLAWEWDIASDTIHWSDAPEWMIGPLPAEAAHYPDFRDLVHPGDRERYLAAGRAALAARGEYACEFRVLRTDGALRWLRAQGRVFCDAAGKPVRMIGVTVDITANKRAEAQLRLAAKVFEDAYEGIAVTGADGCILAVNRRFTEITGYTAEEAVGRNPRMLQSGRHDAGFYRAMWASIRTDGYWAGEIWNRRKDGSIYLERLSISAVNGESGGVSSYVGVFADLSDRVRSEQALRESEARKRLIVDTALDAVISMNSGGIVTDWNAEAERMFGYRHGEALGRKMVELVVPPASRAAHELALAHFLATGEGRIVGRRVELKAMRADGSEFPVELALAAAGRDDELFFSAFVRDITERKRHEEEMLRLNQELERRVEERTGALQAANRELESFSYTVSHDLRAPLRAIDGFSHVLAEDFAPALGEEGRRLLDRVSASALHMAALVDGLLEFSRLGRKALAREPVHMAGLAREVAAEAREASPEVAIEVGALPSARGDSVLLRQVWRNLIANAVKFSAKAKNPQVEIGGRIEGDRAHYFVRDNGAGFDMAHAGKLFGVFERLHSPGEYAGTGIGLATVKRIIERHGGEVRAESAPGEGATFRFSLPVSGTE